MAGTVTTYTPNLRLAITSDMSELSKQNLYKIDRLAAIFQVDQSANTDISAEVDLNLYAGNDIKLGDPSAPATSIILNAASIDFSGVTTIDGFVQLFTDLDFTGSSLLEIADAASLLATKADLSALLAHISATSAHGVTGDVVGTGGAQTLDSKTLTNATIDILSGNTIENLTDTSISPAANIAWDKISKTGASANDFSDIHTVIDSNLDVASAYAHSISSGNPHATLASEVGAYSTSQVDTLLGLKANSSDLSSHESSTSVHGVSGDVVGTSDTQTLSNKILINAIIDSSSNSISNITDGDISATAAIQKSKLSLTGQITNADISTAAAIDGIKVIPDWSSEEVDVQLAGKLVFNEGGYLSGFEGPPTGQLESYSLKLPRSMSGYEGKALGLSLTDPGQLEWFATSGGGGLGNAFIHILSAGEVASGIVTIPTTPADPTKTILTVAGAPSQIYGDDYSITGDQLDMSPIKANLLTGQKITLFS